MKNIAKKQLSIQLKTIASLFVGSFIFCNGTSITYEPTGCAFLSDSHHYLVERIVTVTQDQTYPSPSISSYTQELHYIDMMTGEDTINCFRKASGKGHFTFDPRQSAPFWLNDYFPIIWDAAFKSFESINAVAEKIANSNWLFASIPFLLPCTPQFDEPDRTEVELLQG